MAPKCDPSGVLIVYFNWNVFKKMISHLETMEIDLQMDQG